MSDSDFTSAFQAYLEQVRNFTPEQRLELLEQTQKSLSTVLATAPKADAATVTPSGVEDPVKFNRRRFLFRMTVFDLIYVLSDLTKVLMALGDRFYQLRLDKSMFHQFDPKLTYQVTTLQFLALIARIGIYLEQVEVEGFARLFPGSDSGFINYVDFMRAVEANREIPRTTTQQNFSSALLARPAPQAAHLELLSKAVQETLEQRIERGMSRVRDTLYMKSSNVLQLYQKMQSDDKGPLSVEMIADRLESLGFPAGLCSYEETIEALSRSSFLVWFSRFLVSSFL